MPTTDDDLQHDNSAHIRTAAGVPGSGVAAPWLELIWAVNDIAPDTFGAADFTGPWWAGGSVEEYRDARVIHRGDGTVSVVSKTTRGADLLRQAAAELHI